LVPLSVSKVKRSIVLRKEITELDRQIKNTAETIAMVRASGALAAKMQQLEVARAELQKELPRAEAAEDAAMPARMEGFLKALSPDLKDPDVRLNTAAAHYRLVERIDVADEIADLPVRDIADDVEKLNAQLDPQFVEDPYPVDSKRRRLFSLLITFCGGGKRLIIRTSQPYLISARYEPSPLRT
jgi:seryl-tRNA synthetase